MDEFRWIGREGEKEFGLLCSRQRVTCNRSEEDDRGWDFMIHYPPPLIPHLPVDQRSMGPKALVQIKTTRSGSERWRISLSNALSLARSPLPAFVVRVGLDPDDRPSFRVVHIWREELANILKAGRMAHVDGDENVHRRSVSFDLGSHTARADPLAWMRSEIERIGEAGYAEAKRLFVETLGFEKGAGIIHFGCVDRTCRSLADLQLGLVDGIALDRFSYTASRFGLESKVPDVEVRDCRLELLSPGRHGMLRLRTDDGRSELIHARLFHVTAPGRWHGRARIRAGFLDLMTGRKGTFVARVVEDRAARVPLSEIAGLAMLRQSDRGSPLTIGFKIGRSFNEFGRLNTRGVVAAGWGDLYSMTRSLRKILDFEEGEQIVASINEMEAAFPGLGALDALVTDGAMRIEFTPETDREGEYGVMLAYAVVAFGDTKVAAVASRPVVSDVMIGDRRRIDMGPARIKHASVNDGRSELMEELYWNELQLLSGNNEVMALGDLRRFIERRKEVFIVDQPRSLSLPRLGLYGAAC